jgi:hypothetical protein
MHYVDQLWQIIDWLNSIVKVIKQTYHLLHIIVDIFWLNIDMKLVYILIYIARAPPEGFAWYTRLSLHGIIVTWMKLGFNVMHTHIDFAQTHYPTLLVQAPI